MSDEWDVDSYKTEFENEEHWELRRNFMLAHKDKFSEDELVCLAQVFTNIEFLGCRYPEKTMIRVAELAKGVVESFREKRKDSLKRTFVAASDAASAKVKGQLPKEEPKEHDSAKKRKTQTEEEKSTIDGKSSVENDQKNNEASKRVKYGGVKTYKVEQDEEVEVQAVIDAKSEKASDTKDQDTSDPLVTDGKLGGFVLVLSDEEENPINLIQNNASLNKCPLRWEIQGGLKTCRLFMNGECLGTGSGRSVAISKQEAAKAAIAKLRESYYGIKMKSKSPEMITVCPSELGTSSKTTPASLGEDNVGRKLMKLMGWQGGGLGTNEQGRKQPVAATLHVRRDGLGLKKDSFNVKEFKKQARGYIETWAKSDSEKKLVFSTDFTSEERKIMHQIAKSFSLRSKSYGKEDNRHLVISRRPNPQKILQELLKNGGNSDKYELLVPTKC